MLGFDNKVDAVKAFLKHYDSKKFLGPVATLSVAELKELINSKKKLIKIPEEIEIADATGDLPQFKADLGKMSRVFMNIVCNAVEAMPKGGTFTVSTFLLPQKKRRRKRNSRSQIIFEDSGVGERVLSQLLTEIDSTLNTSEVFVIGATNRPDMIDTSLLLKN
jgi:SpoVK/Ycf46/Vps4 family AAA+-type ATPase